MHPRTWTQAAFGSDARVRVLRLLSSTPGRRWTQREIAREIGMSPNGVNQAVRKLGELDIVDIEEIGPSHAVSLSADAEIQAALRAIFAVEERMWAKLLAQVARSTPKDAACYVFGSSITGVPHAGSDVDILVVAREHEAAQEAAYEIETRVRDVTRARIQVLALDAEGARRRLRRKDSFVRAAVEEGRQLSTKSVYDVVAA